MDFGVTFTDWAFQIEGVPAYYVSGDMSQNLG